jgi:glycosyltransferase involved in cell wall biosynthesis
VANADAAARFEPTFAPVRAPESQPAFAACVVIPVYDHEHAIAAVVDSIRSQGFPILLVDDGSHEACARELRRLAALPGVSLLRHATNRGKGAAVCTGLFAAKAEGFTHAVQIDADGQHTLADVRRFIDEARAYPNSVICGRPVFDASIPRARFYGRYLTHGMVWLETLSFDIIDSMCGFRVYPLDSTIELLQSNGVGDRMDFDTEILVRLHWRAVPARWLATRVSYPLDGVSHFRMFLDNARMTGLHIRLTAGMLLRLPLLLGRRLSRQRRQVPLSTEVTPEARRDGTS